MSLPVHLVHVLFTSYKLALALVGKMSCSDRQVEVVTRVPGAGDFTATSHFTEEREGGAWLTNSSAAALSSGFSLDLGLIRGPPVLLCSVVLM